MKGFGSAPEIAWHYTDASKLVALVKTRSLKPSMGMTYSGESPVVWFTRAEVFEPMAYPTWVDDNGIRHVMQSEKEVADKAKGLLRVGIAANDPCLRALKHWSKNRHPDNRVHAEQMLSHARDLGSDPDQDWLVSFKPVSQKRWKHFQIAFPEDVGDAGVIQWSEWDLRAEYTMDLLRLDAEASADNCDQGRSCRCCDSE